MILIIILLAVIDVGTIYRLRVLADIKWYYVILTIIVSNIFIIAFFFHDEIKVISL